MSNNSQVKIRPVQAHRRPFRVRSGAMEITTDNIIVRWPTDFLLGMHEATLQENQESRKSKILDILRRHNLIDEEKSTAAG